MDNMLDVSIVNTGDPFDPAGIFLTLDFGILVEGANLGCDIVVRSNALFDLSVQSAGKGAMKHSIEAEKDTVPFTFSFEGSPIVLTGNQAVDVVTGAGPTTTTGLRYAVDVTIEPFGMATEGDYSDSITITVATAN